MQQELWIQTHLVVFSSNPFGGGVQFKPIWRCSVQTHLVVVFSSNPFGGVQFKPIWLCSVHSPGSVYLICLNGQSSLAPGKRSLLRPTYTSPQTHTSSVPTYRHVHFVMPAARPFVNYISHIVQTSIRRNFQFYPITMHKIVLKIQCCTFYF